MMRFDAVTGARLMVSVAVFTLGACDKDEKEGESGRRQPLMQVRRRWPRRPKLHLKPRKGRRLRPGSSTRFQGWGSCPSR